MTAGRLGSTANVCVCVRLFACPPCGSGHQTFPPFYCLLWPLNAASQPAVHWMRVLCVCISVCVRVGCQWQPHLVLQIQTPPALPFSPNYFHPSSEAVGFRDVGLVSSLLAASSSPPCHPDLNHPDGCLPTNEPGGWMVGESKNWRGGVEGGNIW